MKTILTLIALFICLVGKAQNEKPWLDYNKPIEERVELLMSQMTIGTSTIIG